MKKSTMHIFYIFLWTLFLCFIIFCYRINHIFLSDTSKVHFIESYGWQVEQSHFMCEKVKIPYVFSDSEKEYNLIQKKAGFDFENYKGKTLDRFSYRLLNHPDDKKYAYINIFVYNNKIVGADVVSPSLSGNIRAINDKE